MLMVVWIWSTLSCAAFRRLRAFCCRQAPGTKTVAACAVRFKVHKCMAV